MARASKKDKAASNSSAAAAFSAIDKLLWKPGSGCSGALDYMEQSSWLLFLRYLDAREAERMLDAGMMGKVYEPALPKKLRWSTWAYPTKPDGTFDFDKALTGDELIQFVQHSLFPGLRRLKEDAKGTDSIQYRIGAIFEQLNCRFSDGYLLREVIQLMQPLKFQTESDRHEMSVAYESRLGEMGNAGRDGGQYYTPRPLIRVMIRILDPKVGEKFDDGACGSAGFICESYGYMREKARNDPKAYAVLQHKTFTGGEVKPLAYVTAQMNCILHGLETPNITFGDTLSNKIAEFTDKDRVDVIGANPPFGAGANKINQQNFTVTTSETALMFMEYFMAKLKKGGRAAIIIKNTFLSNTDNASVAVRRMLLTKCQLNWVLDLPQKVFTAGVHTVVLFFTKDGPTTKPINYYELDLKGVSLGKTRPLQESDLAEFEALIKSNNQTIQQSNNSHWTVDPATLDQTTLDLSVNNPNRVEEKLPTAAECRAKIAAIYKEIGEVVRGDGSLAAENEKDSKSWPKVRIGEVCEIVLGGTPKTAVDAYWNGSIPWLTPGEMGKLVGPYVDDTKRKLTEEGLRAGSSLFPARSVILSTRAPIGYVFINKVPMCTNQGCKTLVPSSEVLSEYLYFNLRGRTDELNQLGTGTTFRELSTGALKNIEFSLPPIVVQREIVARLKKELAAVERVAKGFEEGLQTAALMRKAILKEVFE